jgi:glutamyl-tRNA reductase
MFKAALKARRRRPMFALDLSVPRNISADSGALEDLYLYTIDDLRAIVENAQAQRREALEQANAIVESEVVVFERWLRLQATSSTLKSLRKRAQRERDRLLDEARRELARGGDPEAVMQKLSHRLTNRLLHGPSIRLRQAAEAGDEALLDAARFYFTEDDS